MRATVDGNEAAVSVAYRLNEICCIYPITPSSPMAELADEWSSGQRRNIWGTVPTVVEMQSEGGADPQHTLRALREAEAYDGPSLVIAYSHCIAHGIEMRNGLDQQYRAVASGYWPLIRYDPVIRARGGNPFLLDSPRPRMPLTDYTMRELRYRLLANADPAEAERLQTLAQQAVDQRWQVCEEMAARGAERFPADASRSA